MDNAVHQVGDFSAAAGNLTGIDSDGLGGASLYDFAIGPGASRWTVNHLNVLNVLYGNVRTPR